MCHPAHWVALGHPSLDFGRAAQRIHHTAELDAKPTACRLDQPDAVCVAIVRSMSTARNGSEACKVPALASSDQPRGAYDVRRQDPGKTAGGGHSSGTPAWRNPTITVFSRSPQY